MTPLRSRLLLAVSAAILAAIVVTWAAWPDQEGAADLTTVAPIASTTSPPTTLGRAPTPDPPGPTTTTSPAATTVSAPSRIRIPAVGLDAAVVAVGLRADGQMEVPAAADVGWYRLGPPPGAPGSAVLAAHVDYGGERGAFFDLRNIPVGAQVVVEGGGASRTFTVSAREQVAKADVQLGRYFTAAGPARLTLITCGGVFDQGARHYQDNIILTATPAP